MSYKVDLSELRAASGPLTGELVRRFVEAIDSGLLTAGERLPTTRELAAGAAVNPMTAARVYRRLGELGYVTAMVGRGTFVRSLPPFAADELDDDWQTVALPKGPPASRERILQEAMRLSSRDDIISLAVGMAAPESLPVGGLAAAAREVFAESGPEALAYTDVEGLPELRERLGLLGQSGGFAAGGDEILVTAGARQGIDLVARALLREGDVACVESPSFAGTLVSLDAAGARLIGVPSDRNGLDIDALERVLLRHQVKLVALQPSCQNPTGRHLSDERRRRLVELARERSFFVLEDGVYADLVFSGEPAPALRADAPAHFIYTSSFSKTLGGGLRVGWVAARGPVFNRLVALKMATDLNTSGFDQRVIARYLASGAHAPLLKEVTLFYRRRAGALQAAIARHLGDEADVLEPLGGHSVWLTFRRRVNEQALCAEALRCGVSVTPGASILVEPSARASLRLSFSLVGDELLDEGVRRLASAFRATLRTEQFASTAPVA